jgi:hypothetical protein
LKTSKPLISSLRLAVSTILIVHKPRDSPEETSDAERLGVNNVEAKPRL